MDTGSVLQALWFALVASSAAIALVLALRRTARRRLGAELAYALWSLAPIAVLVTLLPASAAHDGGAGAVLPQLPAITIAEMTAPGAAGVEWLTALLVTWVAGAALSGAAIAWQQHRFVRALGLHRAATGSHAGVPVLRAGATHGGPLVVGALRPRIVLPADFDARYSAPERALILDHERMHVARGDGLANAVAALLRAIFWFNPLLHFAITRFRFDQELACDAAVMRQRPGTRRAYADAMLKTQLTDPGLPVGCHWQSSHPLKERILMLKQHAQSKSRTRVGACALVLLAATFGVATHAAQPRSPLAPASRAVGSTDALPTYRSMKPIDYPKALVARKIEGDVMVRVLVAEDGSVKDARVDESTAAVASELQELTVAGVKSWRFNPALRDGKPAEEWVAITISFRLDAKNAPVDPEPGQPAPENAATGDPARGEPAPGALDSIRVAPHV